MENNQVLSKKDRIILQLLTYNSRISNKEIARKARMTAEGVRQRILQLENKNIIRGYITYINLTNTQQQPYQILAKLKISSLGKLPSIIKNLNQCSCINWVGTISGDYDLGVIFTCTTQSAFETNYRKVREIFEQDIERQDVSVHCKGIFYNREYLVDKKHSEGEEKYTTTQSPSIDAVDRKLLSLLSTDARASAVQLGQKLGISAQTVARKIESLEDKKIITGYSIHFSPWSAGLLQYKILLTLKNSDQQTRNTLLLHIQQTPYILAYLETFASWHCEIDLEVPSEKVRDKIVSDLVTRFENNIVSYKILTIKDMPVYRFFVE